MKQIGLLLLLFQIACSGAIQSEDELKDISLNWKKCQVGEFSISYPPDYQLIKHKDSIELKKGKDVIKIKADWLLTWDFVPKLIEEKIRNKQINVDYPNFDEKILKKIAPQYQISRKTKNKLDYQIAYPNYQKIGFTEILIQNPNNQQSIKISGENLSLNTIKDVIGVYQSIEYQPIQQVFIDSISKQNCDKDLTTEQLEEYDSNHKKYGVPHQIESFEKISQTKAKAKLKIYRNCCENYSFKINTESNKILLTFRANNPIVYGYDSEYGLMEEKKLCNCDCLHCYELTIEGIDNPNDYQFYYEGKKLEVKNK